MADISVTLNEYEPGNDFRDFDAHRPPALWAGRIAIDAASADDDTPRTVVYFNRDDILGGGFAAADGGELEWLENDEWVTGVVQKVLAHKKSDD